MFAGRIAGCLLVGALVVSGATGEIRAEGDTVDKIAVVVGDEVILASELANQVQLTAFQTGHQPKTEKEIQQFQKQILEQMISDKLFLMEARKDTTIEVRPSEVQRELDSHIAGVVENFGSEEAFIKALAAEGMSLRALRRQYEDDIRNNLLRQRYIQQKLAGSSVSKYEVEQFFETFKDSIPQQPEAAKLGHILLGINPSQALEDSIRDKATDLREQILDGADFATISAQHSSLGAGANGGDLGYMEADDLVPEFARAAFKLDVGEVSGVVRTQFGYHVIKCEGKRGEKAWLRHLLLAVEPSAADTAATLELADSLLVALRVGEDFGELAKTYSKDDDTRAQGGELGWFAISQLPQEFIPFVAGWTTPGEFRGPIQSRFGVHILSLLDYQSQKELTFEDDFDRIKELARQEKTGRIVDDWINEIKERTYIDYRLENFGK
ncbi:MAG: peptidylprolyl isomerase [candidate division Zixibacteria bacterium]|nr:peptidylprolyl isomerase [candidate division Zixibacteria bacterium]